MSRLWEKGLPLDERILRYTAGEDHLLDARLVPYDVRGSIAHAEMLATVGLISAADCSAIRDGLKNLHERFDDGEWHISLDDEDVHTDWNPGLPPTSGMPAVDCISVAHETTRCSPRSRRRTTSRE